MQPWDSRTGLPAGTPTPVEPAPVGGPPATGDLGRIGIALFVTGLIFIAIGYFISAIQLYDIIGNPSAFSNFTQTELYYAIAALFQFLGVLLVGAGWVARQFASFRRLSPVVPPFRTSLPLTGIVVFVLGIAMIAGGSAYDAYLAFAAYYRVSLTLWQYTEPALLAMIGLGVLLVAIGWLVHQATAVRPLERARV